MAVKASPPRVMRYLSLFSGIEAASLAWQPLGWEPAAFAEIDPFCCALLQHHYPEVPNLGDVTCADYRAVGHVGVVVGGSPCQSFSIAGKRLGMDDHRGNLALEFARVVYETRPRWFLFENVPGLLSSAGGQDFGALIAALAGYPAGCQFEPPEGGWRNSGVVEPHADGYGLAWAVLNAEFFGVPQRRRRVFIVGYLGSWAHPAEVLSLAESMRGNPAPRREAGEGVARPLGSGSTSSGGYRNDADTAENLTVGTITARFGDQAHGRSEVDAGMYLPVAFAENSRSELRLEGGDGSRTGSLTSGGGKMGQCVPAIAFNARQDPDSGPVTHPLDTDGSSIGISTRAGVRRLTPEECETLQGMPRGYSKISYRGKPAADGPRYRAIGNSMAVPCIRWIGEQIALIDALQMSA